MNYAHNPFAFEGYIPVAPEQFVDYGVPVSHPQFGPAVYPHPIPYHPSEFHEVYFHRVQDYEEYTEHLTRPRLTKEQVGILEAQFQAQPKPNSDVKRQLAIQTNLTLPRVANWFQNRRAKAKQQKRQAEFERMQALAKKGEQSKDDASTQSDQKDSKDKKQDGGDSTPTPTQERQGTSKKADSPRRVSNPKGSGGADPAKTGKKMETPKPLADTSRATVPGPMSALNDAKTSTAPVHVVNQTHESQLSGIDLHAPAPAIWTTLQTPEVITSQAPTGPIGSDLACSSAEPWLSLQGENGQSLPNELFNHNHGSAHMSASLPTHLSYGQQTLSPPFSAMHSQTFVEQRRGSSSSQAGLSANDATQSPGSEKSSGGVTSPFSRCRESRIDLAARRKRPRPAAIGTSGLSRSFLGPSSMSPTTRLPNNAAHGLRHVKSTQNLGSNLSPRYAGVRKMSAALRSPLGFTNPLDSSISNMTSGELNVPPLVTTAMAPPTPLTPEHFQYLLPPTPNDPQFCISPSQDVSSSGWYSASESLPLYIHSPPTTPAFAPQLQYQTHAPMSAAPHQMTFDHAPISEQPESAGENNWTGGHFMQEDMKMPQPLHLSTVPFEDVVMEIDKHGPDAMSNHLSSSPNAPCHNPHTPPSVVFSGDTGSTEPKSTEFLIQEFPEQQEAHRLAAQHHSSQGPRNYTFNNQTAGNF